MGDEENRMPKNARREKNSKKESEREREREKKRETERERERERAARERTAIQYGETRRTVALYQKVPATYIYICVCVCIINICKISNDPLMMTAIRPGCIANSR